MYLNGEGVQKHNISSYIWYLMTKTQGDPNVAGNLELLKSNMTRGEIEKAQSLAAICYESDYKDCD